MPKLTPLAKATKKNISPSTKQDGHIIHTAISGIKQPRKIDNSNNKQTCSSQSFKVAHTP
jgi:hypothetical protein